MHHGSIKFDGYLYINCQSAINYLARFAWIADGMVAMQAELEVDGEDCYKPARRFFLGMLLKHPKSDNVLELGVKDGVVIKRLPMKNGAG